MKSIMRYMAKLHVAIYKATNGAMGSKMGPMQLLLLTTKGAKSGKSRTTPVAFFKVGKGYAVVASAGGSPTHPQWYLNLLKNKDVQVQIRGKKLKAKATPATPKEREKIWKEITKKAKNFENYQKKTKRKIPVVILSPNN